MAADLVLECTVAGCKLGAGETVWKTRSMPAVATASMMDGHIFSHKQTLGAHGSDVGGGSTSRLVKLDRPKLAENCTQQDFEFFQKEWQAVEIGEVVRDVEPSQVDGGQARKE